MGPGLLQSALVKEFLSEQMANTDFSVWAGRIPEGPYVIKLTRAGVKGGESPEGHGQVVQEYATFDYGRMESITDALRESPDPMNTFDAIIADIERNL